MDYNIREAKKKLTNKYNNISLSTEEIKNLGESFLDVNPLIILFYLLGYLSNFSPKKIFWLLKKLSYCATS